MKSQIAIFALAGLLSATSFYAAAAGETAPKSTSTDGTSQTLDPAPKTTNADPNAASLPKGADGGTTDNGPTPEGSKTGASGSAGGGNSSGGGSGGGS
ncbi:hypothetical protein [Pseudomonas sp. NPDC096950]|uniref:hypothetical protein n=1 Tax=Pseudomonas sp. NPDC096950 TaxID=3364485 RepID=UPI00383BBAFD